MEDTAEMITDGVAQPGVDEFFLDPSVSNPGQVNLFAAQRSASRGDGSLHRAADATSATSPTMSAMRPRCGPAALSSLRVVTRIGHGGASG